MTLPLFKILNFVGATLLTALTLPFGVLTIALGVAAVVIGRDIKPFANGLWRPHYWFLFSHLLFFLAAAAVGAIWGRPVADRVAQSVSLGLTLLKWIFWCSLASFGFWM